MPNMYFFWKLVADPTSPFQRLTRTNKYFRCSSTPANHWSDVGAATHNHENSVTGFSCGNNSGAGVLSMGSGSTAHDVHSHAGPSSWTIESVNNAPPGYGLDIVYVDLDVWETSLRYFPEGSVLLSNGELVDAGFLSRFSSADGKYIVHAEPGTTVGTSDPHDHTVSGNTGSSDVGSTKSSGSTRMTKTSHYHTISLTSSSTAVEPKNVVTRLYEVLARTSQALAGTVVFVDGAPGDNWEILTAWDGANIKAGNSDPTVSGSDNHTQTFSGNTGNNSAGSNNVYASTEYWNVSVHPHTHPVSGSLSSDDHIPPSKQVTPARLLNTLLASKPANRVQIIGL